MNFLKLFKGHQKKSPTKADTVVAPKVVPLRPTKATTNYDINVLINKITTITADYNRVRAEIQTRLLTELDDDRQTHLTAEQRLVELAAQTKDTQRALTTSQQIDTPALKQELAALTTTVAALQTTVNTAEHGEAKYSAQLTHLQVKQQQLATAIEQCQNDRQTIVQTLHSEVDPLKILDLAEAYREQLMTTAQKTLGLSQQQTRLASEEATLTAQKSAHTIQLTQVKTQLSQALSQQQLLTTKLSNLHTQQTRQFKQQLQHYDRLTQQTQAQLVKLTQSISQKESQLTAWFGNTHLVSPLTIDQQHHYAISLDAFLPNQPQALVQTVQRLLNLGTEKIGLYSALFDINLPAEIEAWAGQNGIDQRRLTLINPLFQIQNQGVPIKHKVTLPENIAAKHWDESHQVLSLTLTDNSGDLKVSYQSNDSDSIREISYFNAQKLTKRSFYNQRGLLAANALFDAQGQLAQEQYYRNDGLVGLLINYQQSQQTEVQLFDSFGIQTNSFTNTEQLTTWWIKHYFPTDCALIGHIENTTYTHLIGQTNLEAVPYITEANLSASRIGKRLASAAPTRFIVANHKAAQALIQTATQNLELLSLNAVYLPFEISGPLIAAN